MRYLPLSVLLTAMCYCPFGTGQDLPGLEIQRGPYLQGLTESSVKITWLTSSPAVGRIRCVGEDGHIVEVAGPLGASQELVLEGLRPATAYSYLVFGGEQELGQQEAQHFRTASPPGQGRLRAVVAGDTGTGSMEQARISTVMEGLDANLFLHTGDLFYHSSPDFVHFRPYRYLLSKTCLFPSRGNHDLDLQHFDVEWRDLFTVPNDDPARFGVYYSYDWGPAHFTVLDYIPFGSDVSVQLDFVERDLADARARGMPWLVVYQHIPLYTAGVYANLIHPFRERLPELCDRYGVDMVFSGHDHNYQRSYPVREGVARDAWQDPVFFRPRGTVYIVTGGGGGFLYPELEGAPNRPLMHTFQSVNHCVVLDITTTDFRVRALDMQGNLMDEFQIKKDGPRPALGFLRGDANLDGQLDIGDAIATLAYLFLGEQLPCPAAANSTGEGEHLIITKPIYTLQFLFMGGPPPPAPFPACGPVEAADDSFCYERGC